jgi:hypothetical protein
MLYYMNSDTGKVIAREIDQLIVGGEPAGNFAPHVKVWSEMGVRAIILRALKSRPTPSRRTAGRGLAPTIILILSVAFVMIAIVSWRFRPAADANRWAYTLQKEI